jgi:hypothetical protein
MEDAGPFKMSNRSKWRLKMFLTLVVITSFGGPVYISLFGLPIEGLVVWHTMVNGVIGGGIIWGFEILLVPGRYGESIRRLPFYTAALLRMAMVIGTVIVSGPIS